MVQQWSNSLLDLIEHVELNRSGWWDVALDNVLLATVWTNGESVHRQQVPARVAAAFHLQIPSDRIADGVARLLDDGKLAVVANDHLFVAHGVAEQMEARLKAAQHNESIVRATFIEKVGNCCAPHSPESAWDLFTRHYLLPLIGVLGARTLQFMGGTEAGDEDVVVVTDEFVGRFDSSHWQDLRSAIGAFLDPKDEDVRRYVTEHLDASFLVKASGLTNDTIATISNFGQQLPIFRLFLDTNFVFSLLDLHENPSNEAAQMLGKTIRRIGARININMNVIYPTMDEVKRTLTASRYDLEGMTMSPVLADAALGVGISGVAMRYARAVQEATQSISAKDYFDPYINNLTPILKSQDIGVCDEQTEGYRQRQDVINDLLDMAGVDDIPEARMQRKYNAALHDSILWHFVHDQRPALFESPLDAVSWLVTIDYRLLSFDRKRAGPANPVVRVCLHPTELIQILRVWEPRSTDMEQALMSGLRLPFMFYEFDLGEESASMRILKILSRFEHISDLGPEAIRDIVLNDAVRSKIAEVSDEEEAFVVIRDALLAEHKNVADQRDAAVHRAKLAEEVLANERQVRQERDTVNRGELQRADARISELEVKLRDAHNANRGVSERLQALEAEQNTKAGRDQERSARARAVVTRGIGGGVCTAAATSVLGYAWYITTKPSLWTLSTLLVVWLVAWFIVVTIRVRDAHVSEWAPMRILLQLRRFAKWLLVPILVAVLGNAIWQEVIRPLVFG